MYFSHTDESCLCRNLLGQNTIRIINRLRVCEKQVVNEQIQDGGGSASLFIPSVWPVSSHSFWLVLCSLPFSGPYLRSTVPSSGRPGRPFPWHFSEIIHVDPYHWIGNRICSSKKKKKVSLSFLDLRFICYMFKLESREQPRYCPPLPSSRWLYRHSA